MWYGGHGYLNLGSRIPSALQAGNFITNNHFYVLFYVLFFPPHCPTIISALYSCSTPLSVCIFFFFFSLGSSSSWCVYLQGLKHSRGFAFPVPGLLPRDLSSLGSSRRHPRAGTSLAWHVLVAQITSPCWKKWIISRSLLLSFGQSSTSSDFWLSVMILEDLGAVSKGLTWSFCPLWKNSSSFLVFMHSKAERPSVLFHVCKDKVNSQLVVTQFTFSPLI